MRQTSYHFSENDSVVLFLDSDIYVTLSDLKLSYVDQNGLKLRDLPTSEIKGMYRCAWPLKLFLNTLVFSPPRLSFSVGGPNQLFPFQFPQS